MSHMTRAKDEGAWANRYPDMTLLSERVPDHPVYLRGLHSFAVWGNRVASERAGITTATEASAGGIGEACRSAPPR